jgi:hypothetical protein
MNPGDPLTELARLTETRKAQDLRCAELVQAARTTGASWSSIAAALSVTKQAAHGRYAATMPTGTRDP